MSAAAKKPKDLPGLEVQLEHGGVFRLVLRMQQQTVRALAQIGQGDGERLVGRIEN